MKVLWFTNIPLPGLSQILGRPPEVIGGWMATLLDECQRYSDIEIGVATSIRGHRGWQRYRADRVTYYCLPGIPTKGSRVPVEFQTACDAVMGDFGADVVHVHGTEEIYGLYTAMRRVGPPVVVSIQGLIHVASRHVAGGIEFREAQAAGAAAVLSWLRFALMRDEWTRRGETERAILAGNRFFIGRTKWDKAHVLANNPNAKYFHCDELLRPAFYRREWNARSVANHTIFCTAAHSPLKGFHVLLDAVAALRPEFSDIKLRVAGAPWDGERGFGYYGRFLKSMIDDCHLSSCVTPLPLLSAELVAEELANASAFVIPSLIENSPNSLGEAMLVGTPCVASLVGGIPSLIEDGRTALGFHSGDAPYLAHCIRRLFTDESLAQRLSSSARAEAMRRHDPTTVVNSQLQVYREIVGQGRDS